MTALVWFVRVRSVVLLLLLLLLLGVGWLLRGLPLLLEWVLWLNLVDNWLLRLLSIRGPPGTRIDGLRCLLLRNTEKLD